MFWVVISCFLLTVPSCYMVLSSEHREIFGSAVKNVDPNSEMYLDILEVTKRFGTDPDNWSPDAIDTIADIKSDLAELALKQGSGGQKPATKVGGSVKSAGPLPTASKPKPSPKTVNRRPVQTYVTNKKQRPLTKPTPLLMKNIYGRFQDQPALPNSRFTSVNYYPNIPVRQVPTHANRRPIVHIAPQSAPIPTSPYRSYKPIDAISFDTLPSPISQIPPSQSIYNLPTRVQSHPIYTPTRVVTRHSADTVVSRGRKAFYRTPQRVPQAYVLASNAAPVVRPAIKRLRFPTYKTYYNNARRPSPPSYYQSAPVPPPAPKVNSIPPLAFNWGRPPSHTNPSKYWSPQIKPRV